MKRLLEDVVLRLTPLLFLVFLVLLGVLVGIEETKGDHLVAGILAAHLLVIGGLLVFYLWSDE